MRSSEVANAVGAAGQVTDLDVSATSDSSATLSWTQVDDGSGGPASYRLRHGPSPMEWQSAAVGCDPNLLGSRIGARMSCTVQGLDASTEYDFQLMSYRTVDNVWTGATYSNVATGVTGEPSPMASPLGVADLAVLAQSGTTLVLGWTQIDDGTGAPAKYRVKYASPAIDYSSATIGCDRTIQGTAIGGSMSCTVEGLVPGTTYDVQLMSYRTDATGAWLDALPSNVATATTPASDPPAQTSGAGIWISPEEIAALPTSGPAWDNLLAEASGSCGSVDLADQTQSTNVCILAKALVFARTGTASYRSDVLSAVRQIVNAPRYSGRALALGRELGAYVIAADLIDLEGYDATLDRAFRAELRELLTTYTSGAASNLVNCHERRPNNWGTMCGASRAAVAVYLGDEAELERTAQVFRGYLGERSAYASFAYGADLSWQCDAARPVGINPAGCTRYGRDLDGVLPDDQRRGGSYSWPPPAENYVWEALQGALTQAVILERAGYPVFQWGNQALRRAVEWLHRVPGYPPAGDDRWQLHLINRYYGTSYPAAVPTTPGKVMGWTDWTHGS